jgi:hypothetical protein
MAVRLSGRKTSRLIRNTTFADTELKFAIVPFQGVASFKSQKQVAPVSFAGAPQNNWAHRVEDR